MLKSTKKSEIFPIIFNLTIAVFSFIGTVGHFRHSGIAGSFTFYTVDSNIFLMLACTIYAAYNIMFLCGKISSVPNTVLLFKYFSVCTVSVTFFVVIFVLAPLSGGIRTLPFMLFHGELLFHHFLCPLLGIISFLFTDARLETGRSAPFLALIPTFIYGVTAVILNICGILDGPYPFLRVMHQPVWLSIIWMIIIAVFSFFLAFLIWMLGKKTHRS